MLFAHDTTTALLLAADLVNSEDLAAPAARGVAGDGHRGPAGLINDLLRDAGARPRLVDHGGGWGWHLHVTAHDAALEHRLAAQAGFAFADLIRLGEADRLRRCEAPGCEAVFTDLSRNRSRRYCDTGNCGNRQHVAAYRDRLAAREASRGA